jgi:protein-tyrosine phosphatase/membrane-associated phospholipid phosphatase
MGDLHRVGGSARRALMLRTAQTSILLSLLFLVVYGSTNWLTAQRPASDVGTWFFAWELSLIPFVPLLIVPYMTIDLLFFIAPFLCCDQHEIRVFRRRVVFVILTAGVFFLVLPLKLAWPERPRVEGTFGDFVEMSCTVPFLMEYPHNLFPTLHIALCLILADVYARHTRGLLRVFLCIWFFLIGVSTVLTWQHHVIDVAGGLVLAAFAFYLFSEPEERLPVTPNPRIGAYYTAGAILFLALVPALWPWGLFLLWPAAALGIVAGAYFGRGPGIFRKTQGRLPLCVRFFLAPALVGQHLSLWYYRRQCRAWDEAAPGVLIGCTLTDGEATTAVAQGVTAVLDLTAEFSAAAAFQTVSYRNLPILDLTEPTPEQLREAVAYIAAEAAIGCVYVHCKIGYSRSAAVIGAHLLTTRRAATPEEAVAWLRQVRPTIVVRPEAMQALQTFAREVIVTGASP